MIEDLFIYIENLLRKNILKRKLYSNMQKLMTAEDIFEQNRINGKIREIQKKIDSI